MFEQMLVAKLNGDFVTVSKGYVVVGVDALLLGTVTECIRPTSLKWTAELI